MSKSNSTLTAERLREVLDYDPETGVFTTRIKRQGSRAGVTPGYTKDNGYSYTHIDTTSYMTHRLVWLWVNGSWPIGEIDHIDGDKLNNRIANLRDVDRATNTQNSKKARRNNKSSGLLGSYKSGNRWQAQIRINGVCMTLGSFGTPEEAHASYLGAKRLFHPGCTI